MTKGLENYPVLLKGSFLQLPSSARLRLRQTNVFLRAEEWVTLVNTSRPGALLMVVQQLNSTNAHCLEGIHLAEVDGKTLQVRPGRQGQVE